MQDNDSRAKPVLVPLDVTRKGYCGLTVRKRSVSGLESLPS